MQAFFIIFIINIAQASQSSESISHLIHEFVNLKKISPIPLLDLPDDIQKQYDQLISVDAFNGDYVAYLSHQASIAAQYFSAGDVDIPAYFVVINTCIENINRFIPYFQNRFETLKEAKVLTKNSDFLFDPDSPDFESNFLSSIKNNDYPLTSVFLTFIIIKRLESFVNQLRNLDNYSLPYKKALDFFLKASLLSHITDKFSGILSHKMESTFTNLILDNLDLPINFYFKINNMYDFTSKKLVIDKLNIPLYIIFTKSFEKLILSEFILPVGIHFLDISQITDNIEHHIDHDLRHLAKYIHHVVPSKFIKIVNQKDNDFRIKEYLKDNSENLGYTWNSLKVFFKEILEIDFAEFLDYFFELQHEYTNAPSFYSKGILEISLKLNNFSTKEADYIFYFVKEFIREKYDIEDTEDFHLLKLKLKQFELFRKEYAPKTKLKNILPLCIRDWLNS
jgi:hypothetical protein